MFTEAGCYSALAQRYESLALEFLEQHRRVVRSILSKHGGRDAQSVSRAGQLGCYFFPNAMIGTLLNHYQITCALGAGGMGEAFRARDTRFGQVKAPILTSSDEAS